jgi:hypothetical protein
MKINFIEMNGYDFLISTKLPNATPYVSNCISFATLSFCRLDSQLVEEGVLPDQFHIVPVLFLYRAQRR